MKKSIEGCAQLQSKSNICRISAALRVFDTIQYLCVVQFMCGTTAKYAAQISEVTIDIYWFKYNAFDKRLINNYQVCCLIKR